MPEELQYDDMEALSLLGARATLAGEVEQTNVFHAQSKPCLMTMEQLQKDAARRNDIILGLTKSSGDRILDQRLLDETKEELECGWAEGPFDLSSLEWGATIPRRFALVQGPKTRMIDDLCISGVNERCIIHNKIDLHLIDTFAAAIKSYFSACRSCSTDGSLLGKTYDLKSAHRWIYTCEQDAVEVYRFEDSSFRFRT